MRQPPNTGSRRRELSTRSIVLSALLGQHPPALAADRITALGELFDIPAGTVRVALSRMVAAGELTREGHVYTLSDHLHARQASQDLGRHDPPEDWDGRWWTLAVAAGKRDRHERDAFRTRMKNQRFAELRDGIWTRPTNLPMPTSDTEIVLWKADVVSPSAQALAGQLWDLAAWATRATELTHEIKPLLPQRGDDTSALRDSFMVSAHIVRHLRSDPLLPAELLPADWPGKRLRADFRPFTESFLETINTYLDGRS